MKLIIPTKTIFLIGIWCIFVGLSMLMRPVDVTPRLFAYVACCTALGFVSAYLGRELL